MNLSPAQKETLATWIADGASIADVQKRLREEFQVSLTYMDTRLLIDDLGLNLKSAPPPPPPKVAPAPSAAAAVDPDVLDADAGMLDDDEAFVDEADDLPPDPASPAGPGGSVKVDVDRIMRPGTVVSGSVTFSDGSTGKWALDQYGRLMFEGAKPGQRPSPADLQAFQQELSRQLQQKGY